MLQECALLASNSLPSTILFSHYMESSLCWLEAVRKLIQPFHVAVLDDHGRFMPGNVQDSC